jgi:hypothetical protein
MSKIRVMKIGWTNSPLLVASVALLTASWFVPDNRDPAGQGDILLSMMLAVRALALPPSKWVTIMGCVLTTIALAGNLGILPGGLWKIATVTIVALLCVAILFWGPLASRISEPGPAERPRR